MKEDYVEQEAFLYIIMFYNSKIIYSLIQMAEAKYANDFHP